MSIINKFKFVLSKIKVAQLNKKKKIQVKIIYTELIILDALWKNGFIYGYTKKVKDNYNVFLRYSLRGLGILNSISFSKLKLNNKQLKTLIILDPNYMYLMLNNEGIVTLSRNTLAKAGGTIIVKL
jgi:ribosomal protein S8